MSQSALFQPIQIGPLTLKHRVVLSPLTRFRSSKDNVPFLPMMKEYYAQRATTPGTFLVTEATLIAQKAGLYEHVPGIWNDKQIAAWKEITDAVHANGSYIFLQLWALGRTADPSALRAAGLPYQLVSASDIPLIDKPNLENVPSSDTPAIKPRPLTKEEIQEYASLYATAASNAVNKAGFDGVEIHGANGYLIDQFLQDVSNERTDEYGGSIENRSRFALEVTQKVTEAVGEERTAFRISPWSPWQDMGMSDPVPTFSYLASQLKTRFPKLAYLHVVEPRVAGVSTTEQGSGNTNDFIRDIWFPRPLITAGNYTRESAIENADKAAKTEGGELIAFGRQFLANPDLPVRLEKNLPVNAYNRDTFYLPGDTTGKGYTDYPFYSKL